MAKTNIYAERAMQRKKARSAGRPSNLTREQRLTLQCQILADRLALALSVMTRHEELVVQSSAHDWMKHLEDWSLLLKDVEPAVADGRERRFDHYRKQSLYRFWKTGIRALVRRQVLEDTGVELQQSAQTRKEDEVRGNEPNTADPQGDA